MKKSLLLCIASILSVCAAGCADPSNDCEKTEADCTALGQILDSDSCTCKPNAPQCDVAAKTAECSALGQTLDVASCTCKPNTPQCDVAAKTAECAALGQTLDVASCTCKPNAPQCDVTAKTAECAAAGKDFDATNCDCKDKTQTCDTAAKTAECAAAGKDFDATNCDCKDKTQTCDTAAKTAECAAAGKDFDEANCDCKDKTQTCDTAAKTAECNAAGKDFDEANCDCKDKTSSEFKVNEVPASQNNTIGANCDPNTFVEHCSGNKTIYCDYASDEADKTTVVEYDCAKIPDESGYTCAITLNGTANYTECVSKTDKDTCDSDDLDDILPICDYDDDGYEFEYQYTCKQFNDGKNHYILTDGQYCSNLCSDGCKQTPCNASASDVCSTDKTYLQECVQFEDSSIYVAYDCSYDEMICSLDGKIATCIEDDSAKTCDPTTYPGKCSEDGKTRYYCDNSSHEVVSKPCNSNTSCVVKGVNSTACEASTACTLTEAKCNEEGKILDNQNCTCVGDCVEGGTSYCKKNCSSDGSKGFYFSGGKVQVVTCENNNCTINASNQVVCEGTSQETCTLTEEKCNEEGKILDNQKCACVGDCVEGGTSYCKKNCSADGSKGFYFSNGVVKVVECENNNCTINAQKQVVCEGNANTPNPNPGNDDRTKDATCNPDTYHGACSDDLTKRYYCNTTTKVIVESDCTSKGGCDPTRLGNNGSKCKN